MTGLTLIATGAALPANAVTNEDLSKLVDTDDAWIRSRTGIGQRYFCGEGESAMTLAIAAAKQALERSGLVAEEIGCCICATLSGDFATPSLACMVQAALGLAEDIPVFDLNAACSGFLYAATAARGQLLAEREIEGSRKYALVIGVEQLSRLLDMTDRGTCVLFGDGAGAAVLALAEDVPYAAFLGARGSKDILAGGAGPVRSTIKMDGKSVFRFAVDAIPKCVDGILTRAGMALDEVDWVVCHQANERIIDHCVKKLKAEPGKFYKNMERYGNTSAASIPIALNEMRENGLLKNGQSALCVGFGGGLTWAGMLLSVAENACI